MVLQRPRQNLGGACRRAVDEQRHRQIGPTLLLLVVIELGHGERTAAETHDLLTRVEKEIGHAHAFVEQSAGIAAQIDHQRLHPRLGERIDRVTQLERRLLAEDRQCDVPHPAVEQQRVLHRMNENVPTRERVFDRCRDAGTLNGEPDDGPRCAAKKIPRVLDREPAHSLAIDLDDSIAGLNAGGQRRSTGQRRDDRDPAVAHVDLRADARVFAGRPLVQRRQHFGRQISAVRIVEIAHHAVDRVEVQRRIAERVHVLVRHALEHLVEQMRAVHRRVRGARETARDEPSAGRERASNNDSGKYRTGAHLRPRAL